MNNVIFESEDVYFSYLGKYPALRAININIRQKEKITVIGANGSGKSTLLHVLDGLLFADSGTLKAFGKELKEDDFNDEDFSRGFRKRVGLVFQNPDVQLFCPTVKEDIVFGPLQLGTGKKEIEKRLDELVHLLDIADLLERSPHQLSIGEKRKVAIASTLIIDPDVLILDEPTAGLDPLTTRHIIDLLIQANQAGKTIITSTHDLHLVEEISDTVYVFSHEKRIVKSGNPDEVLKDEQLLLDHNLVHIHAHRHKDKVHVHPHLHIDHHGRDKPDSQCQAG
jgi:cobalt/nickel transport system ATP-binding protein